MAFLRVDAVNERRHGDGQADGDKQEDGGQQRNAPLHPRPSLPPRRTPGPRKSTIGPTNKQCNNQHGRRRTTMASVKTRKKTWIDFRNIDESRSPAVIRIKVDKTTCEIENEIESTGVSLKMKQYKSDDYYLGKCIFLNRKNKIVMMIKMRNLKLWKYETKEATSRARGSSLTVR